MKTTQLKFGLLLFLVLAGLQVNAQTYFNLILGDSAVDEKASRIYQVSDGSIYVLGSYNPVSSLSSDVFLSKLDSSGEVVWEKFYGDGDEEYPSSWYFDESGGTITFLYESSNTNQTTSSFIHQVDLEGNTSWVKEYTDTSGSLVLRGIIPAEGSGFACSGFVSGSGFGNDFLALKTDDSGNELWRGIYGGDVNETSATLQKLSDGYMLFGDFGEGGADGYRVKWIKIDFDGTFVSDSVDEWSFNSGCKTSCKAKNGNIYVVGESATTTSAYFDVYLACFDSTGNQLWKKMFKGSDEGDAGFYISEVGTDTFLITGYSYNTTVSNTDMYALLVDADGNFISKNFHDSGSLVDMGYCIIPSVRGGYLVAGSAQVGTDNQVYIVYDHLDEMPSLGVSATLESQGNVVVWPTQITNYLNVSTSGQMQLQFFDLPGKEVHRTKVARTEVLDVSFLEPGMYLLRFSSTGKFVTRRVLVH